MREVYIAEEVMEKLSELDSFLQDELKFSKPAARKCIANIDAFLAALASPADYTLCRFKHWRALGYRCATFKGWVFAYEIFDDGVIVRDMSHGKLLIE